MKNVLKITCLTSVLGAFALFASCESRTPLVDIPGGQDLPPVYETQHYVSVNFGDGEEVWTAAYADWMDFSSEYGLFSLFFESPNGLYSVEGAINSSGTTTFESFFEEEELEIWFEYYSGNWYNVSEELARPDEETGETIYYGDWQANAGTVTLTSTSSSAISGVVDLTMVDYYDWAVNYNDAPAEKNLSITFTDVPVYKATRSGIVRVALARGDRKLSFTNSLSRPAGRR